ncbi:MAG TPA: hypothetical protein VJ743_11045 [Albitalea sp.]|nr:hypothetical protein [Albitalea sp.]
MPYTITVGARSLFVTVTAWAFIALGALASVLAVVQHAHVASLLPEWRAASEAHPLPLMSGLLMAYLPAVLLAALAMSMATLASAIGLLLRLDWARRVLIGVLAVAIVANLAGLWLQHEVVHSVLQATLDHASMPRQVADVLGSVVTAARVMALLVTLGSCLLMAWIIRSLMSPRVRQEFA